MIPTFRRLGPSELLPRYIFAEALFARRRVLEVGAVAATRGSSAEFLMARGARSVLAVDAEVGAVEEAQKRLGTPQLRFRADLLDDLPEGGFDVILVADLAPYVHAPQLFAEVAARLSPGGTLLGGLRNPAGLALAQVMDPEGPDAPPTYGQLLDVLSGHFACVDVATQSPLLGYQLAFERGDGLQVDGSLAGNSEAAYYVVLASREPLRALDPTWVQLPPAPLAFMSSRVDEFSRRSKGWEERAARMKELLGQARAELEEREGEASGLRTELERVREAWERAEAQADVRASHSLQAVEQDELATRVKRLELELNAARERAEGSERLVERQKVELLDAVRSGQAREMELLAVRGSIRQESVREQELEKFLGQTRERLGKATDELNLLREEQSAQRVDADLQRVAAVQGEEVRVLAAEITAARGRELRLAEQQSASLARLETLEAELREVSTTLAERDQELIRKEQELAHLARLAERDAQRLLEAQAELQKRDLAGATSAESFGQELAARATELAASERELEALKEKFQGLLVAQGESAALNAALEERMAAARDASALAGGELAAVREELEGRLAHEQTRRHELQSERDVLVGQKVSLERAVEALTLARAEDARLLEGLKVEAADAEAARGRVAELEGSLAKLAEQAKALFDRVKHQDAQLTRAAAAYAEEVARLQAALTQAEAERGELSQVEKLLRDELDAAQARSQALDARSARADGELDSVRQTLEAQATRLRELSHSQESLEGQLATESVAAESLRAQVALAEQARADGELKAAELHGQLQAVQQQLSLTADASEGLTEELRAARADLAFAQEQGRAVEAIRDQLRADLAGLREGNGKLEAKSGELVAEVARLQALLEHQIAEATTFKGRLDAEVPALSQELARVKVELARLSDFSNEAQGDRDKRIEERDRAHAELTQLAATTAAVHAELGAAQSLRGEAEERAAATQAALKTAHSELAALKEHLGQAVQERATTLEALERARGDAAQAVSEREGLSALSEGAQEEIESLERCLDGMKADLVGARSAEASAKQREMELTTRIAEREAKLDVLQRRLTAQESELSALRRATGRGGPNQVKEIYERASAELSQVKADLGRRPSAVPYGAPRASPSPLPVKAEGINPPSARDKKEE